MGGLWSLVSYELTIFEDLQELEVINLNNWHINLEKIKALISGLSRLKEIDISNNFLDFWDREFFLQFENLTKLNFNFCHSATESWTKWILSGTHI